MSGFAGSWLSAVSLSKQMRQVPSGSAWSFAEAPLALLAQDGTVWRCLLLLLLLLLAVVVAGPACVISGCIEIAVLSCCVGVLER